MNLQKTFFILVLFFLFEWNNTNAQYNSNLMPFASIDREISLPNYGPPTLMEKDKCSKYKKMLGSGIGLMMGGLLIIPGRKLILNPGPAEVEYERFFYGLFLSLHGVVFMGAGSVLTIIGSIKSKQYCNKKTSNLNLVQTQKGIGLQLSF
ncbi:MAG TPA: hypothetical protein PLD02_02250 [Saprospiraceae bacterium]|nr:hypothetical protein [Saprospiraceae bacterium]